MPLKRLPFALAVTLSMLLASCGSDTEESAPTTTAGDEAPEQVELPQIVVTTSILGDITENVVGELAEITVLMPPGTDPHDFEPSAQQVAAVLDADLVIANGLQLEEGLGATLDNAADEGTPVIEIAPRLSPIEFSDGHGNDHGDEGDDHGNDREDEGDVQSSMSGQPASGTTDGTQPQATAGTGNTPAPSPAPSPTPSPAPSPAPPTTTSGGTATTTTTLPSTTTTAPAITTTTTVHDHEHEGHGQAQATLTAVSSDHDDGHGHGDDGDDHGELDPHVWMDVDRMAEAAAIIAAEVAEHTDVDAEQLDEQATAYESELRTADEQIQELLAGIPEDQRKLVTNHEAFGYFADRYGFTVIGTVIPGGSTLAEPSAADLAELLEVIEEYQVPAIFVENISSPALADTLVRESGRDIEIVELFSDSLGEPGSGADTYITMMITNAERIADALG